MVRYFINIILFALFTSVVFQSCESRVESHSLLEDAETAFNAGQYEESQTICDSIAGRMHGGENVDAVTALKVALLYVKLGEKVNKEDDNMVSAWRCMDYAYKKDADKIHDMVSKLDSEEKSVLMILRQFDMLKDSLKIHEYPEEGQGSENVVN